MKHEKLDHLLQVLADRDIDLGRDDVQWTFESSRTEPHISAWVDEFLHPPTLLTQEEFVAYDALPASTRKQNLHRQHAERKGVARPFTDKDVKGALESLESSTASIEAHAKQLEIQREALLQIRAQNESVNAPVGRGKEVHLKNQERENRQLKIEVEELLDELWAESTTAEKEAQLIQDPIEPFVNDTLQADDHLLAGLTTLMLKLRPSSNDETQLQQVDQWCRAVISFQAAEVTSRVEAIRLRRHDVQNGHLTDGKQQELEEEKQALEAEMDTLKAEIISVLSMVVDHEFRRPIKRAIREREGETAKSHRDWSTYISNSLNYTKRRLDAIEFHAQSAHAYKQALNEFQSFLAEELPEPMPEKTSTQDKKRKSRDLRALFNPQTGLREFLLGKSASPKEDSAERLLRHFDIRSRGSGTEDVRNAVELASTDRQKRLQEHYESTDRSMLKSLAESLGPTDTDLQDLLSSVYEHTEFNGVRLSDEISEKRIHSLESAIDNAVKELGKFDSADTEALEEKIDDLTAKWL